MYKLLIADDEPFIPEGIKHIINWEEYGLELTGIAYNGVEALELVKRSGTDILITDIRMPKMNGLELIREIKKMKLETKFIVLSGYDDFEYLKESIKLGIENYLIKPVNEEELSSTLANTIDKIRSSTKSKLYSDKDIHIIKNNILFRWITGYITEEELKERSLLLDINLKSPPYATCLLRLNTLNKNDLPQFGNVLTDAEKICADIISRYDLGIVLCTPEGDIAFIINSNSGSIDGSRLKKALGDCVSGIKHMLNVDTFVTIGCFEDSFTMIRRSFDRAMDLQQYSIVMSPGLIIDYNELEKNSLKTQVESTISFDEINKLVAAKNIDSLNSYLEDSFQHLMALGGVSPSFIRDTAIETLFSIINSARSTADGRLNSLGDLCCSPKDIYNMNSIEDILHYIKETSKKIIEFLVLRHESLNPVIRRVIDYIKSNYCHDICLKTLSIELNINPNYLGQLFKDETGEFFNDYVNNLRINKAKELLSTSNMTTKDISLKVGYTDPNYFYKTFRKYSGVSPTEFRNL